MLQTTNFSNLEFDAIWNHLKAAVPANWNQGRGRKSHCKAKIVLLLNLIVIKDASN